MKKFSLALALFVLTFVACTTDSQDTATDTEMITKNTSGNATIDALYNSMINSAQHIAYKKAQKAFLDKTKYTGNFATINTSAKLITWIGQNLRNTKFTSASAAQAELNNVRGLYNASVSANMNFYNAIGAQPNPGHMWGELTTSSWPNLNPCGCLGNFFISINNNGIAGEAAMDIACGEISVGNPNGLEMGFDAINAWEAADNAALATYNACIAACFGN